MVGRTMAKARDIPGLHADLSYREAAARTVSVRAQEVFEHAEGVLDTSDIERVHDMRVASRRLRAVLEIYEPCFPRKAWRDVLDDVKALADALGERRDPDVHLAQLEEFAAAVKDADRPGVEVFAERVRSEQGAGNEALAPPWPPSSRRTSAVASPRCAPPRRPRTTRDGRSGSSGPDRRSCEGARRQGPRPRRDAGRQPRAHRRHAAGRAVLVHSRALDPARIKALHDMRIAAKRLRYILEVAAEPCFGPYATAAIKRTRDLQDLLGELHDCDVQLPRVRALQDELRAADALEARARAADAPDLDPTLASGTPHAEAWRGLETLCIYVEARRGLLFERFLELWRELEREGFRPRLRYAIGERPEGPTPLSPSDNGDHASAALASPTGSDG